MRRKKQKGTTPEQRAERKRAKLLKRKCIPIRLTIVKNPQKYTPEELKSLQLKGLTRRQRADNEHALRELAHSLIELFMPKIVDDFLKQYSPEDQIALLEYLKRKKRKSR